MDGGGPPARRPPATVLVAIAALVAVVVAQATLTLLYARRGQAGWAGYGAFLLLFGLLVTGLARGSRLAWLWGRYLTLVLGVVVASSLLAAFHRGALGGPALAMSLCGLALPLAVAGVALGRRGAYPYFRLVCPVCGARSGIGADLLFKQARCPTCGEVW